MRSTGHDIFQILGGGGFLGPENNGFHGNRSTEPGMAAPELVYESKDVELAGLSNQTIKGCVWETGRPEKRTTLHQTNAKNCTP